MLNKKIIKNKLTTKIIFWGNKMIKVITLIITIVTLTGCMSQMVQPEGALPANFEIRTVSVKSKVTNEVQPFVQTPGEVWGNAIGGLLGAAIASESIGLQFGELLKKGNVDLKKIVRNTFREQLASPDTKIKLAKHKGDVSVQLEILFYGIHPDGPFSSAIEPMLEVGGKVFDSKGRHVLNIHESLKFPSDEEVTPHEMDEYAANPKLLVVGFTKLSRIIANSMIKQLASHGSL